jgi:hypothetical protein
MLFIGGIGPLHEEQRTFHSREFSNSRAATLQAAKDKTSQPRGIEGNKPDFSQTHRKSA